MKLMQRNFLIALMSFFTFVPFFIVATANAQGTWQISKLAASSVPEDIVPDTRELASNGLPDGRVARANAPATIVKAWYSSPTGRYSHGILGDAIEAGSLVVVTDKGVKIRYQLQPTDVFEDIAPRLADLDGDGRTEVITIQSSLRAGASLAIYQVAGNVLIRRARSKYIGRPNRWLNIAGISNYTANRTPEIALVVTPHIGGRLDLYRFSGGKLIKLMEKRGFSNHVIGSREQRLSASYLSTVKNKANLALPSTDRRSLEIMAAGTSGWVRKGIARLPGRIDKAIAVSGSGNKVKFTVGLSDGSVYSVFKN